MEEVWLSQNTVTRSGKCLMTVKAWGNILKSAYYLAFRYRSIKVTNFPSFFYSDGLQRSSTFSVNTLYVLSTKSAFMLTRTGSQISEVTWTFTGGTVHYCNNKCACSAC
jgi:hypothetical protein